MKRNLVVVGASAGGVGALQGLVAALPKDFPAAVMLALHVPSNVKSFLPEILSRHSTLGVSHAVDGEPLLAGRIYVAPPDCHLLVEGDSARLTRGPRENGSRPAVDPLFRSAARWRGSQAIGIVLSGMLDDGTAGLASIQRQGGVTIVQDPKDASFPDMPRNAMEALPVNHVAAVRDMGELLTHLTSEEIAGEPITLAHEAPHEAWPEDESDLDAPELDRDKTETQGRASTFTCPDCHGALWEMRDGHLVRYRCRVGHAFSPDSLLSAQLDSVEAAMWIAHRSLESASMAKKMGERALAKGMERSAAHYQEKHSEALQRAHVIHSALVPGSLKK